MELSKKAVTIISGGMDSTTLAHYVKSLGYDQLLLSFNYGQRHVRELVCARQQAIILGCEHRVVDLALAGLQLNGSALVDPNIEVPEGWYSEENMKLTVVPNRNMIMLAMAYGLAISNEAEAVFAGVHNGDFAIYPDCRPDFIHALNEALLMGNRGFSEAVVETPFIYKSKAEICKIGLDLGVDFSKTWTCYQGGEIACGKCGTCTERLEAFAANDAEDSIDYVDRAYWKTVQPSI